MLLHGTYQHVCKRLRLWHEEHPGLAVASTDVQPLPRHHASATDRHLSDFQDRGLYATSGPFHAVPAYVTSVETSVYMHPDAAGHGAGSGLYGALLAEVDAAGVHQCFAGMAQPNEASVRLHLRHGFEHVGTFDEAGFGLGRFWDVHGYRRAPGGVEVRQP